MLIFNFYLQVPFLSPEISPSGSSPMVPKIPHMQPIRAFPPPPPNAGTHVSHVLLLHLSHLLCHASS